MAKKDSATERLRTFLLSKIGEVVTFEQLRDVARISEWARRIRELRERDGWQISSHHDDSKLRPGEYMLVCEPRARTDVNFARTISARLRAEVLDRNGFTCQMCGLTPGEIDPYTSRKVRLHIGHIKDKNLGGKDELSNLRALCSTCNQGAKNITHEKPSGIWLLGQVRRAGIDEQRAVYEWLERKFRST